MGDDHGALALMRWDGLMDGMRRILRMERLTD